MASCNGAGGGRAETFGEREQRKRALVLDSKFTVVEEIPLSLGPQHRQLHWLEDSAKLQALALSAQHRLKVTVPPHQHEEAAAWKASVASSGTITAPLADSSHLNG